MPLAKINIDGVLRSYRDADALRVGEKDGISHSFDRYATRKATTLQTVAVSNVGHGLSITDTATDTSTGLWSAKITGVSAGMFTFDLKATFANGNIQPIRIEVEVVQ